MPSSAPLSQTNSQPQPDTTVDGKHLDRVQSELNAVQQQALATQQALKKLQTRESVDPVSAIANQLPQFPAVNGVILGSAVGLTVALAVLWWFVWYRPKARLMAMPPQSMRRSDAPSTFHGSTGFDSHPATPAAKSTRTVPGGDTVAEPAEPVALDLDLDQPASASPARSDAGVAFDPDAAASEVMRVRKSLADKREARSQILEREDASGMEPLPSIRAWLDSGLAPAGEMDVTQPSAEPALSSPDPWQQPGDAPYGEPQAPIADEEDIEFSFSLPDSSTDEEEVNVVPPPAPAMAADRLEQLMELDLGMDPEPAGETLASGPMHTQEPVPAPVLATELAAEQVPVPMPDAEPVPDAELVPDADNTAGSASAPESEPALQLAPESNAPMMDSELPTQHDYAVTLALAQESADLQLWAEARDMAIDVLESHDEALRTAAQDLLESINRMEMAVNQDTIPWDETR